MGLDLYHLKATLEPERPEDAFAFDEGDLDEYTLNVLGFRRFIRSIPDVDYPTRIIIVRDEESRRLVDAKRPRAFGEAFAILIGDPAALEPQVERAERQHGLNSAERSIHLDSTWEARDGSTKSHCPLVSRLDQCRWGPPGDTAPLFKLRPSDRLRSQHVTISYPEPCAYRGLYAEEVGYQRKTMANAFYSLHRRLNPSARFADVRHTYFFVGWDHAPEWDLEARKHFIEQFIVPFEPGRSLIYASF